MNSIMTKIFQANGVHQFKAQVAGKFWSVQGYLSLMHCKTAFGFGFPLH